MNIAYPRADLKRSGSALILTVVITVLLAVIGSVFVLMARVEKTASSARTSDQELKLAVESVATDISQVLAMDVPGMVDPNNKVAEYYDYPGDEDIWLANIEPYIYDGDPNHYKNAIGKNNYRWRQITDLYDRLKDINNPPATVGKRELVCNDDYAYSVADDVNEFAPADADGDGIVDSRWFKMPNITTSEGKDVYTAVRIIDNGGMININTTYKFDANSAEEKYIDGSSVAQIDLASMAADFGGTNKDVIDTEGAITGLHNARCDNEPNLKRWNDFSYVQYYPRGWSGSFDVSTELDLRNRFFLNPASWSRFENVWPKTTGDVRDYVYDGSSGQNYLYWFGSIDQSNTYGPPDSRHFLTAVSADRAIGADGERAYSINREYSSAHALYNGIRKAVYPSLNTGGSDYKTLDAVYAQVAASLYDYRDTDSEVTGVMDREDKWHFGYERPCIWISELVTRTFMPAKSVTDANPDPSRSYNSYAIEVYKQHETSEDFNDWRLVVDYNDARADISIPIDPNVFVKNGRFFVQLWETTDASDPNTAKAKLDDEFNNDSPWQWLPADGAVGVDPNAKFVWGPLPEVDDANIPLWKFEFYFGDTSPPPAKTPNPANSYDTGLWRGNNIGAWAEYDPGTMLPNHTYYWRLVDIDPDPNGNPVGDPNHIYKFTTGAPEPNVLPIDMNDVVFDANTVIRLIRPYKVSDVNDTGISSTKVGELIVDQIDVPKWLVDHNDPNRDPNYTQVGGVTRSYNRDLYWGHIIQRIWDVNGVQARKRLSLGDWNNFGVSDANYLWVWPRNERFDNVGDVALMLRKSVYMLAGDDPCLAVGYSPFNRLEENVRIDMADPNMQRIFNYISVFDPQLHSSDPNFAAGIIRGRINVNTAPWRVLTKLPWVANRGKDTTGWTGTKNELAEAIVAYRDKLKEPIDYFTGSGIQGGREFRTGIGHPLREEAGFESVAELAMVTNKDAGKEDYDMWWYKTKQVGDQLGYPDLTQWYWRSRGDGIGDDFEERYLIFSRISDICTVRSDVFTAYILVRLGADGPQRRMIAIFDRSGVTPSGGKVKILALQPVPEVR